MAAPVANFNFYADLLEITFEDLSSNVPTSWDWDFGDGTPHGNTKNPIHLFSDSGTYLITLIATNSDGSSTFKYKILVSTAIGLNQTIEQMVTEDLPNGFEVSPIELTQSIRKWQMYLQPKVYIPFRVNEADTFDQSKWPGLSNVLVAMLVVYDQLIEAASKTMLGGISSSSGGNSKGALKRIESGPSVSEWYDNSEFWKTVFNGTTDTGFFGSMTQEICMMAGRQNISIPELCGQPNIKALFGITRRYRGCTLRWPPSHG